MTAIMFWKTDQLHYFVFYRGKKVHHSFVMPRKNKQNEPKMLRL
jgi:hypothetical protein